VEVDEYAQARPSAALLPFVGFYTGYRQAGVAPARHRGLPSPYLTLIFTIDDPMEVAAHPDPRQAPGRYDSLIGGLHLTPAMIIHAGWQSGVQVALRPLGCRALFGLPAAELAGLDVEAAAVLGDLLVDEVRDRLRAASDWPSRFAVVDAVLLRGLRAGHIGVAPEIAYAVHRLFGPDPSRPSARGAAAVAAVAAQTRSAASVAAVAAQTRSAASATTAGRHGSTATVAAVAAETRSAASATTAGRHGGTATVAAVAAEIGWSARYLTDRFRAEVGLRPKEAARVARFDRARRAFGPGVRPADIAAVHGYADQSHLVREFRAFAGCTPTRWLADEYNQAQ
jgi:AraC-like DNA-binding protein